MRGGTRTFSVCAHAERIGKHISMMDSALFRVDFVIGITLN